jgi:primosomal protein N' (replication factor Y)
MTQVAGRAGRRDEKGRVLIQTAKPGHPVLEHIISTDYIGFYKDEIAEREHFFYPPFSRLIRITLKHKDALELHKAGQLAERQFSIFFGTKMLGPEKPYIGKVRNLYLLNFLLKLENQNKALQTDKTKLREALNILNRQSEFKSVKFVIDVDPQ